MLLETWLDASHEPVNTLGYQIISRRDRREHANRGGTLMLTLSGFFDLAHIYNSVTDNNFLNLLLMGASDNFGGKWYRPGASEHDDYQVI